MFGKSLALFLLLTPNAVLATQWVEMSGGEIASRLTDEKLIYEGATQTFYASGKTLYDAGMPSWGNWRVDGDRYCSQWPPGQSWDCYKMDRNAEGTILRFLDAEGRPFVGKIAP